jgi:hypothetical protein
MLPGVGHLLFFESSAAVKRLGMFFEQDIGNLKKAAG